MRGLRRLKTILAPVTSAILAGWTITSRSKPKVSTTMWRLRPLTFLCPSTPRSPPFQSFRCFGYQYSLHWVALLVLYSFATVLAALCWPSPIRRCLARLENSHRPSFRADSNLPTPASHSHVVTHSECSSRFPADSDWVAPLRPTATQ